MILQDLEQIPSGLTTVLKDIVQDGGALVLFPAQPLNASSYQVFMEQMQADLYQAIDTQGQFIYQLNADFHLFAPSPKRFFYQLALRISDSLKSEATRSSPNCSWI